MWHMLLFNSKDLQVSFHDVLANDKIGSCYWEAAYTFSGSGRKVLNVITAAFEFRDGKYFVILIILISGNGHVWHWARREFCWDGAHSCKTKSGNRQPPHSTSLSLLILNTNKSKQKLLLQKLQQISCSGINTFIVFILKILTQICPIPVPSNVTKHFKPFKHFKSLNFHERISLHFSRR